MHELLAELCARVARQLHARFERMLLTTGKWTCRCICYYYHVVDDEQQASTSRQNDDCALSSVIEVCRVCLAIMTCVVGDN